jgi:hypothetical protein
LSYQIRPSTGINRQSAVIKVAIALVTTILALSLINSLFCFSIFQMKKTRDFGCGLYLFASSINRSFVYMQCVFIDFLLGLLLSTSDWLSACVAMERAANVSKGISFNRTKSIKVAKWMILFGCMKSARNPWLYFIGYFFSFIPPTLIFIVFVLSSEVFKREFYNSIGRFWQI